MPTIRVEMWRGCTKEQKAEIARVFTAELSHITHKSPPYINVLFQDYEQEDWAIGGELASDIDWAARRKQTS